jgi:predicted permease
LTQGIRFTLKLPLIWAMLAGLSLHLLEIELPLPLEQSIHQLGQAAIPIALVILGMQLADTRLAVGKYELAAIASRLLLAPFIAYAVGKALGLEGLDLQVLILQSAMPAAVNSLVLVAEFGGDAARVARTIAATTLLSCVTLPVVVWAAARF